MCHSDFPTTNTQHGCLDAFYFCLQRDSLSSVHFHCIYSSINLLSLLIPFPVDSLYLSVIPSFLPSFLSIFLSVWGHHRDQVWIRSAVIFQSYLSPSHSHLVNLEKKKPSNILEWDGEWMEDCFATLRIELHDWCQNKSPLSLMQSASLRESCHGHWASLRSLLFLCPAGGIHQDFLGHDWDQDVSCNPWSGVQKIINKDTHTQHLIICPVKNLARNWDIFPASISTQEQF